MLFNRLIEQELLDYFNEEGYKPVIITGARQIGKTTMVKKVAENFESFIYVNLEKTSLLDGVLDKEINIDKIITLLEIEYKTDITANTLLIFDEIQANLRMLMALKYFNEETNLKVIATGSNLGLNVKERDFSFPVGKVKLFNMYPMTFEEFLLASDNHRLVDILNKSVVELELDNGIHDKLLELFDVYISFGGMPEVISAYLSSNILKALSAREDLLSSYINDFSKYADPSLTTRLETIYDHIDIMLASDNQKFKFMQVDRVGYSKLVDPLKWLFDTSLVIPVYKLESINLPLRSGIKNNSFKLMYHDVGILQTKANYLNMEFVKSKDKIYYGQVMENYIAQVLVKYHKTLFYYHRNTTEIDYLIQYNNDVIPIEVKSGNNTKAKSLDNYIKVNDPKLALKTTRNNYSKNGVIQNIPLYALDSYLRLLNV